MTQQGLAEALIGARPNLLDYIPASGVVVHIEGQNFKLGATPDDDQLNALVAWLHEHQTEGVFSTPQLAHEYSGAKTFLNCGAGLLSVRPGSS